MSSLHLVPLWYGFDRTFAHLLAGMLLLKSQESSLSLSPVSLKYQAELTFWEQLQFSFDMDNEPPAASHGNSHSQDTRRARSISVPAAQLGSGHSVTQSDAPDAALLAQFAAAAAMSSHGLSPTNPYGSLMPHGGYSHSSPSGYHEHLYNHGAFGHNQLPSLSSLGFPWHLFPAQIQTHQIHHDQSANFQPTLSNPEALSYPYAPSSHSSSMPNPPESPTSSRSSTRAAVANAVASSSTSDPDQTEAERIAIAEEKRRRNTAASARFRIKKKQKNTNLERSVSDLAGRAEDLEREAADLRRENGWLKEIVVLKGSRLAGLNLASHILAENAPRYEDNFSQQSSSGATADSKTTGSDSDEAPSDEEAKVVPKTKKGKSRKK